MAGFQSAANIIWGPSRFLVQLEFPSCRDIMESRANVRRSEAFQELLVWLADAIVHLIPRCPQGITTGLWQLHKSQRCIICRGGFERDVTVPDSGRLLVLCLGVKVLALHRRYCADFWIIAA